MPLLPAFCPTCGAIFDSPFRVENSTNVTFIGARTNCPMCGGTAELPDATFNVYGDTLEVLAAAPLTRERLRRLAFILESERRGQLSEEEAIERIREEAPGLAPLIDRWHPKMRRAFMFFLTALVSALIAHGVDAAFGSPASPSDVQHAVEHAIRYCENNHP